MASNGLYMPLYVGDYLSDADHLSTIEHGAYLLLIMNYWKRSEPLPADDRKLARIARMTDDEWASARGMVLEFFTERDGLLHHNRIDSELQKAKEKSAKAKESANSRHAGDKRSNSKRNANAEQAHDEGNALKVKGKEEAASAASARPPDQKILAEFKTGITRTFAAARSMNLNPNTHRAATWLAQGYDPALCLAVLAERLAKKPNINDLSYFDNPIREAHEKRAPAPAPDAPKVPTIDMVRLENGTLVERAKLEAAIAAWDVNRESWWQHRDRFGMPPKHPACGIPRELWPQEEVAA